MTQVDKSEAVFEDARGKRIAFLSHCVLKQNARIATCAFTPATVPGVVEFFIDRGIGMIQGPCPEFEILGLGRRGQIADQMLGGYEHEDGEIYDQLSVPDNRRQLTSFAESLVSKARRYLEHDFEIVAILGVAGSPACGINVTYYEQLRPGKGAYIEEIEAALKRAGLDIPLVEVNDLRPHEAIAQLEALGL